MQPDEERDSRCPPASANECGCLSETAASAWQLRANQTTRADHLDREHKLPSLRNITQVTHALRSRLQRVGVGRHRKRMEHKVSTRFVPENKGGMRRDAMTPRTSTG